MSLQETVLMQLRERILPVALVGLEQDRDWNTAPKPGVVPAIHLVVGQ